MCIDPAERRYKSIENETSWQLFYCENVFCQKTEIVWLAFVKDQCEKDYYPHLLTLSLTRLPDVSPQCASLLWQFSAKCSFLWLILCGALFTWSLIKVNLGSLVFASSLNRST